MKTITITSTAFAAAFILSGCEPAEQQAVAPAPAETQPAAVPSGESAAATNVYFGDTHLHTSLSVDAGTFGNRLGLEDAYRFVRGEAVTASTGVDANGEPLRAQLRRPLDFVVIADHSDGMGIYQMVLNDDPEIMQYEEGPRWRALIDEGKTTEAASDLITNFSQGTLTFATNDPELMKPVWKATVDAAEKFNEPGKFTAFIGYEWTSLVRGNNLHRNVIYRGNADTALQTLPFTNADSSDPEDLWEALAAYEEQTGGRVLAIPHNGNLSNGLMFDVETLSGGELTVDYARKRQQWEPLYETTQIKGDGETHPHPLVSPDDEFADYETWDTGNLDRSELKKPEMLPGEYARSGLKRGLEFEQKLGVNPYKFGQIGSTDAHTSLSAVEEDNFYGKHSGVEPGPERWQHLVSKGVKSDIYAWQMASSGYAGVWATENTRASLWDAMKRRETYATTGSRLRVRFFGGFDFAGDENAADLYAAAGYAQGVPMGGDLSTAPEGKAPTFLVAAAKDERSGNLDRIQVVKGWLDADGKAQERVYDVAVSDGRKIDEDGRCRTPVGNTVKVHEATWEDSIGAPQLNAVWTDPDFDVAQRAFYYARVIEIPTPRWTAYEALRYGLELPDEVPLVTQERAYTSPIWYTP